MTNNTNAKNWIVVVAVVKGERTYLGSLSPDTDVSDGSKVREDDRCGVKRVENALRFTKRGAARIAKGYEGGFAVEAE